MEKISVNSNLCDGCLNCESMCASVHSASRIKIIEHHSLFYSIVCQHCESAPCIKICPTDAISDESVDTEKCIGSSAQQAGLSGGDLKPDFQPDHLFLRFCSVL